jgi:hypothetical protein
MERQKIHLNALYRGLEDLFGEKVKPQDVNGRAVYAELNENGTEYCLVKMDTKSLTNLLNLAKSEYLKFKEKHPDNTLELFVEIETEQANYWQSHFTKWQYDARQKEWYSALDRWKLALKYYWGISQKYSPEYNPALENDKAYLRSKHNLTFINISTVIDAAVNLVKPIWPNVELNKYYHDFFNRVDFINLPNEIEFNEGNRLSESIGWGFEELQNDIKTAFADYRYNLINLDLDQINAQRIALMIPIANVRKMAGEQAATSKPHLAYLKFTQLNKNRKTLTILDFRQVIDIWGGAILFTLHEEYLQVDKMLKEIATLLPTKNTITSDAPPTAEKNRLKVKQIALIHAYNQIQITRENANDIAAKHDYKSKTSGEGLFHDYTFFSSPTNRKGKPYPYTKTKLKNKIELFESVLEHLEEKQQLRAIDEIKILKGIFEAEQD